MIYGLVRKIQSGIKAGKYAALPSTEVYLSIYEHSHTKELLSFSDYLFVLLANLVGERVGQALGQLPAPRLVVSDYERASKRVEIIQTAADI
nr:hypothetical protein A6C57_01100 [Fibrella sp. ES10-3-2-2]